MRVRTRLSLGLVATVLAAGCAQGNVFELAVGDCFQHAEDDAEEVADVEVVDCEQPHDNEVFHTFDLEGDEFPEEQVMWAAIEDECLGSPFESYFGVSYDESEVLAFPITPTEQSWDAADDRTVVCAGSIDGEQVEGSLQGSGR